MNDLIDAYFELAARTDVAPYLALFADDATVTDEGRTWTGLAEIRAWRTEVPLVRYTVQSIEHTAGGELARVEIAGDFPGSPVQLSFVFEFAGDGKISRLAIG
jgi:hypothetical protein